MQTTLETLGQLERRLNVAVPLEQIDGEVHKRLARLAKTVKIAGFRPGKVPLKMVAQQYGPQVRSDVISDTVQASLNDAIREQNLRVAGYPRIEPKEAAAGDQLEFSAIFEVYPEIQLGELSGVTIERPVSEVTPADVDRTIEILRHQNVRYEVVARPAGHGDRAVVDFTGTIAGVAFPGGQAKDFPIVIGEARMLPEFESALMGMTAGETKTFGLTFPADYHGKEVAGKAAEFTMTVQSVSEPKLPQVDSEFAVKFGIASGSVEELRAEIGANLKLELKRKIEGVLREQVLHALKSTSDLIVPRSLVELEAQRLLERAVADLQGRGVKAEDMQLSADTFRPQAEERVAYGLIVNEITRVYQLSPKPEQVLALVREAAQAYEQPEAVVRWHYEKPGRLNEFEAQAVEQNVVEWALQRARVEDRPTSFSTLMEPPVR
ncbi:MAG TPA: trigger factor [Casimicrobiaceae bacterium]|jgi:trigger factor|nr:trigger factor [Casimicrobiaceae bacterium]